MTTSSIVIASLFAAVPVLAASGQWFDHVMIIQFENHAEAEVIKDPNFNKYR
jgi:hypothetical protein